MRPLTGPAASGKTFRVLSEFGKAVRAGGARLLAPTATLQRHDGHCRITPEETAAGFAELRAWVDNGTHPKGGPVPLQ